MSSLSRWFLAGLLIGFLWRVAAVSVGAQNPGLLFGSDSSTGAASVIQTDGSNALKVTGK